VASRLFLRKALELKITISASDRVVKESCEMIFTEPLPGGHEVAHRSAAQPARALMFTMQVAREIAATVTITTRASPLR
jgi:hypothetical protein